MAAMVLINGLLLGFVAGNQRHTMQNNGAPARTGDSGARNALTAELLGRCAAGDGKAFRTLYETQSSRLYGVALRITRNPALASDAVHDAMLQVWRNAARYDTTRGAAESWLVSLVRYRALDIARRQARETTGAEIPEREDESPDALSRMMTDADSTALRGCLQEVDEPRRRLVMLAFIRGMTQTEIASYAGQPLGTVKSSIRRALLALRACLTRVMGAEAGP